MRVAPGYDVFDSRRVLIGGTDSAHLGESGGQVTARLHRHLGKP